MSMSTNWVVVSFSWYIMGFYVHYFHGNMYLNGILLGLADVFANILTRSFQLCTNSRLIFLVSYIFVATSSVFYLIFSSHYIAVPICIVLMRSGLTIAFSLCYYGNYEYFLPQYSSTVFGATNIPAWVVTILCPFLTEMVKQPIYFIPPICILTGFFSLVLRKPNLPEIMQFEAEQKYQDDRGKGEIQVII